MQVTLCQLWGTASQTFLPQILNAECKTSYPQGSSQNKPPAHLSVFFLLIVIFAVDYKQYKHILRFLLVLKVMNA